MKPFQRWNRGIGVKKVQMNQKQNESRFFTVAYLKMFVFRSFVSTLSSNPNDPLAVLTGLKQRNKKKQNQLMHWLVNQNATQHLFTCERIDRKGQMGCPQRRFAEK